jgi:guanylate kinase
VTAKGKLIIVSGPSGAGKSTVVRRLLETCPLPIELSVSATTRPPRQGEVDGREYHFVSKEKFQQLRAEGSFLECKEVFGRGDWYGTLRQSVDEGLQQGKWVLLEIDVQGAICVMEQCSGSISFFVHPGSLDELENRLRRRATDSEEAILRRLQVAADELRAVQRYRYEIINRDVEQSVAEICQRLQNHNQEGSNARST